MSSFFESSVPCAPADSRSYSSASNRNNFASYLFDSNESMGAASGAPARVDYSSNEFYETTSFGSANGSQSGFAVASSAVNSVSQSRLSNSSYRESPGATKATVTKIASDLLQLTGQKIHQNKQSEFGSTGSQVFLSAVEQAILNSSDPISINETEEIEVHGQRGIWANKAEVTKWSGVMPIERYQINQDANPEVITKRSCCKLEYIQELAIKYLRPPTPPAPGEIIITQESSKLTPPAPPLVIRQQPPRPSTPEPLVIREAPPPAPPQVGRKCITISGKQLPPAPRKVVIERLAPLPAKPQSVLIERWLPYTQAKRRVVFQAAQPNPVVVAPRNVVVQWEAPEVSIRKDYKYLGVVRANPADYVCRYGQSLKNSRDLPSFVLDFKTPPGLVLAADYNYNSVHELEGDVDALNLIDLDREGLSQYRHLLKNGTSLMNSPPTSRSGSVAAYSAAPCDSTNPAIAEIFAAINLSHDGRISQEEAEKVLLKLNSRFGRSYGENEAKAFFRALDVNNDRSIELNEFKKAFENLL